jgi:hypothetical protein
MDGETYANDDNGQNDISEVYGRKIRTNLGYLKA